MNRNQTIAIAVILIIVVGAAGVYIFMFPPAPPVPTLVMGTTDSVETSLDIAEAYDYFGWEVIGSISSGLVDIRPGSQAGASDIVPALATSWVSSDAGATWTFTLRQGVKYPDGREFNATDIKYTFDRNCNLTGNGLWEDSGPQLGIGYANDPASGTEGIIKNVTIMSAYSVRFYLNFAFQPFLQLMAATASFIVDRAVAPMNALVRYDSAAKTPMALGPYLLQEWLRVGGRDDHITLIKNPDYWNITGGNPKTDRIIINMYASNTALAAAMTAHEVDIAYRQLTTQQVAAFKTDTTVKVWEGIGAQIQYLCFNQMIAAFQDPHVRQGIAAGINRTHVCEAVFQGTFDPLYSMIPTGMAYHNEAFSGLDYNITKVQELLALAGYNTGNKLKLNLTYESSGHYPQSADQAQVYKSDWEATGVITVTLAGLEWSAYKEARDAFSLQVYLYGWYPDYVDADDYEFLPFASWLNMGYNATYPVNGTGTDQYNLWTQARSAPNDTARAAAYTALQNLQAQVCSVIPIWQSSTVAVTGTDVRGVVLDISVNWRHWLVYLEAPTT
jgi:peptide/nickel transport system substrate-binding protein